MWEAIGSVSSIITLVAFIVAAIITIIRIKWLHHERLIEITEETKRETLVLAALDRLAVNTEGLTKEQRFKLAIELIKNRAERFKITANRIVIIAIIGLSLMGYSFFKQFNGPLPETLLTAVESDNIATVRTLLNRGTELNIKNNDGNTALHLAALRGYIAIVKILLEKGVEINAKNNWGETALYLATSKGDAATVQELLDKGADINAKNNWGVTPLFMAVSKGYSSIVQILLTSGADVNARDNDGKTVLMEATEKGYTDIVEALLKEGAEVNVESNYQLTALRIARERGRTEIVEILIQHGADN